MNNKKWYIITAIFSLIFTFFGASLARWVWTSDNTSKTSIALTIKEDFRCDADGGGDITSNEKQLVPTDCTNTKYAIQRTIKVTPTINSDQFNVLMNLWLDINSINTNLKNSDNFKYALTTQSNNCTVGTIASGTFKGKTNGSKIQLLDNQKYSKTFTDTYYLYIWLDTKETNLNTREQSFSFSLNGECVNESKVNPFYAVYSEEDIIENST